MRPEILLAFYILLKAFFLGGCAYVVLDWPLFLTLPSGLFLAFIPVVSEAGAIYLGAKAFGISYLAASVIVLVPLMPLTVLFLKLAVSDWLYQRKAKPIEKKSEI